MRSTFLLLVSLTLAAMPAGACGPYTEPLPRPAAITADIQLPREFRIVVDRVRPGTTLAAVLRINQVAEHDINHAVARAQSVFDLRKFRTAQPYRIEERIDGTLHTLEYEIDGDRFLRVTRANTDDQASGFSAEVLPIAKTRSTEIVRGRIDRSAPSLFAAMEAAGETVDLSLDLADIFSGEIDFHVDLQPGDTFELLVEKQYREGHVFAGYGPILGAEFDNAGRRLRAVRFIAGSGAAAYYDEHGRSMRRFLLKSPLKFQPIVTSGFSRSRLHPILREYRAHLGVDYRAPAGAPVIAVADGVVVEAGANGGAGRMVHLRHPNAYESEYLHLSAIAVRRGARVRQGDLIGRVGATGLATGPHLDYRLKKNGVFINPLTVHRSLPPSEPVPAPEMAAFNAARDRVWTALGVPPAARASSPVPGSE